MLIDALGRIVKLLVYGQWKRLCYVVYCDKGVLHK